LLFFSNRAKKNNNLVKQCNRNSWRRISAAVAQITSGLVVYGDQHKCSSLECSRFVRLSESLTASLPSKSHPPSSVPLPLSRLLGYTSGSFKLQSASSEHSRSTPGSVPCLGQERSSPARRRSTYSDGCSGHCLRLTRCGLAVESPWLCRSLCLCLCLCSLSLPRSLRLCLSVSLSLSICVSCA
jgi:hypothetical protein